MKRGRIPLFRFANVCLDCGATLQLPADPKQWDAAYVAHLAAAHPEVADVAARWIEAHGQEIP